MLVGLVVLYLTSFFSSTERCEAVTIQSPNPVSRPTGKVPILIGRSAAAAKQVIEDGGFQADIQIGVDAPQGVQPFTVYAQEPVANAPLAAGGTSGNRTVNTRLMKEKTAATT